jgi:two-component system, NtrC family, sensor histidine kinase PilS
MSLELEGRLRRLMVFRVVMVTTLLFIATYVEAVAETSPSRSTRSTSAIVATYALTVAHALALRFGASRTVEAYAQVAGDLLIVTALVYVTGGVRPGFQLLFPLVVLSATMLVSRRGALSVAAAATLLYGGLLLGVRAELFRPRGLEDVFWLPPRMLVYAVFVLGVACATVALLGSYLAEGLRHAGRQLREAAVEVADLRGLNQVIVDSIQSGLMTIDALGRVLHVNAFGEGILGRPGASLRGAPVREVLSTPLLGAAELKARAASRALARLELSYRRPEGRSWTSGSRSRRSPGGRAAAGGTSSSSRTSPRSAASRRRCARRRSWPRWGRWRPSSPTRSATRSARSAGPPRC